jgi:hypothetical protein
MLILRSVEGKTGKINVTAKSEGLKEANIQISSDQ